MSRGNRFNRANILQTKIFKLMEQRKQIKGEIKYNITLNEEQKEAKRLILENQIVIITGRAGSGKSLVGAITALDLLFKKQYKKIIATRALIEVGRSMGFLPGDKNEKFNPYMEALLENLYEAYDHLKINEMVKDEQIKAFPVQFVRGKTVNEILIVEEAQNLSKEEMLAILTRLGKEGKIIINGDQAQKDTHESFTGLDYAIELSKKIIEIKHIKLKENHRSDLVGRILDYEYTNK